MNFLYCDVCGEIIFNSNCEQCGFNNSYQFIKFNNIFEIYNFIKNHIVYSSDEKIILAIIERFGLEIEEACDLLNKFLLEEYDA